MVKIYKCLFSILLMKIVCLEGCSGTGKTTQYHLISDHYSKNKLKCLAVVEKNYEPFKSAVLGWHKTKGPDIPFTKLDVDNFAKARYKTFLENFSNLENEIDLLLMDRYFYTSAVYQRNSGLKPEDILKINIDNGAPVPNLTFLFDDNPVSCFERARKRNQKTGGRHFFSTSPEKISKIREQYLKLSRNRQEIKVVDASKPLEEITKDLVKDIDNLFH